MAALVIGVAYLAVFMLGLVALMLRRLWNIGHWLLAASPARIHPTSVNPEIVITLIHGTFARGANWTQSGSDLCTAIRAHFAAAKIGFRVFAWSGRYSSRARQKAAAALRGQLETLFTEHPLARHYLIGHSHGGTVLLEALSPQIAARISGLICLATPLLSFRERRHKGVASTSLGFIPFLLCFWLSRLANHRLGWLSEDSEPVLLIPSLLTAWLIIHTVRLRAQRLCKPVDYRHIDTTKAVFLRAPADEASAAISAAHFISWMVGKITMLPLRIIDSGVEVSEVCRNYLVRHYVLTACLNIGCLVLIWQAMNAGPPQGADAIIFLISSVIPVVCVSLLVQGGMIVTIGGRMLVAIILMPFVLLAGLFGLVIGPELVLLGVLTEVNAEACPPGRWTVVQLGADSEDNEGLRHSSVYQSPESIKAVLALLAEMERRTLAEHDGSEAPGGQSAITPQIKHVDCDDA